MKGIRVKNQDFVGMKRSKWRPFLEQLLSQTTGFINGNSSEDSLKDRKTHEGFKNDKFTKEMFLLKAQKHI